MIEPIPPIPRLAHCGFYWGLCWVFRFVSMLLAATACADDRGPLLDNDIYVPDDPVQAAFVLGLESNENLVRVPRTEPVFVALLSRPGLERKYRFEALAGLARIRKTDELTQLINEFVRIDEQPENADVLTELAPLIYRFAPGNLIEKRKRLYALATCGKWPTTRQVGYAALLIADQDVQPVWMLGTRSNRALTDVLACVPLVKDADLRAAFYARIEPLLLTTPDPSLRRAAIGAIVQIPGHDVQTFRTLAKMLLQRNEIEAVIQGMGRLNTEKCPQAELGPVADVIVQYVAAIPARKRTRPVVKGAIRLAEELATLLPAEHATTVRQALNELSVREIQLGARPHQMLYDKTEIAAQAGTPVEIVFENRDIMPHNLIVVRPGSMLQIGQAAEKMATLPGAAEAHYVPPSDDLLVASKMLQPGESQSISFMAPEEPGVYPYLCTFPGHWRRMFGRLLIVANLDEYLVDPMAYLARNDLPLKDQMLVQRTVVEEYSLRSLLPLLTRIGEKRSFENAQTLFTTASCAGCHQVRGLGGKIGPDLTDVAKRLAPEVILEDIVDPSKRIHEKFRTWMILRDDGTSLVGIIVNENDRQVQLVANPTMSCEPIVIPKSEIDESGPLSTSTMPKGLLDRLTREEILDLLTYVIAGGNQDHKAFDKP